MMNWESVFKIAVVIFTVSNLFAMGLESNIKESAAIFKKPRFIIMTLFWGWVAGPLLALLIARIVPMHPAFGAGLVLVSLAPTAPFYPVMVREAKGDMAFAAAFILLVTVGTVLFMPLMVPILIDGLAVDSISLAKPLVITVLLPMVLGVGIKYYFSKMANKMFPVVKKIGSLFTLIVGVMTFVMYWPELISAVGSFAPGGLLIYLILMAFMSYKFSLGLRKNQRSALSLGMCTRNIAAVFVAYFSISNPDPRIFVMLILVVLLTLIVSGISAKLFSPRKSVQGATSS